MKIIVTQPKKQYVAGLLEGLAKNNMLALFCSQFISNKLPNLPLGAKVEKFLRKRQFNEKVIHKDLLRHQGVGYMVQEVMNRVIGKSTEYLDDFNQFDEWAAKQLPTVPYDMVVAYENANLFTFNEAQKNGKVTILDLAQVHHDDILKYMKPVWSEEMIEYEAGEVNPYKVKALEVTDYIMALSEFARESMVNHGWPADRIYSVNLGINPAVFNVKPIIKEHNQPFTFLFVGSIMVRKGIEDLLSVWAEIHEAMNAKLVFVGPMADGKEVMDQYAGIYEHHPFMHHEDLADEFRKADIYVLPSLLDSWAQTVIEAMACGTAALVSDCTGAMEAVAKGGGWVVSAGDKKELKAKLLYCYEHKEEVITKGEAAAKIALQYTWENYHRQVLEVMKDIAKKENIN